MELDLGAITAQARQAAAELLEVAKLEEGALFVVGCSSSEIVGGQIGHASSLEAAQAVFAGIYPLLRERGIWLAAQCCEHLNRALILERDCARQYGYDPVCVVPQPKAGLDIGGTLIGMHLRDVAVPVRLSLDHIGQAILLSARTRPKLIGGSRAVYE